MLLPIENNKQTCKNLTKNGKKELKNKKSKKYGIIVISQMF